MPAMPSPAAILGRCCLLFLLLSAVMPTGCASDRVRAENDRLREQVMELEDELAQARGALAELTQQLARAASQHDADVGPPISRSNLAAAQPLVTALTIGRLSHAQDADGDGVADHLMLYVRPSDGRGRFLQMVGSLQVIVGIVDGDGSRTIGRTSLDPLAVRDAYRSGITGTHYTVTVPIAATPADETCHVVVLFDDALTGKQHRAERDLPLREPRPTDSPGDD